MKLNWLLSIILLSSIYHAQDPVILTINDSKVYKSEFEQIYWKNKKEKLATKEDLDEYIELFINFKLKVIAAENKGLDTIKKFINELKGYQIQLEKPYLTDTSINEDLIQEAYFRTVNEINASHIMIKLSPNPNDEDTLKAWEKISEIRKQLISDGKNFENLAVKFSEDPSVKYNKGNLGYFGAFKMIYSFEEAAYTTPIGEISPIIKTRYGYHILKPHDIRKAKGKVKTSHIMIAVNPNIQGENEIANEKINTIHSKLADGESFNVLAQKYSEDRKSAKKGGDLGWIESGGNVYKEFEDAVFSLKNDNDYSMPFKTPNGWHIVKRSEFEEIGDFEELKYELKNKIQKDIRSQKTISSFLEKLKKEYNFRSRFSAKEISSIINNKNFNSNSIKSNDKLNYNSVIILSFAGNNYFNLDFISFLKKMQVLNKCKSEMSLIKNQFEKFTRRELLNYEKTQLSEKYPAFKALLKEYRDGILLFEISDQMIWSKAVKDTIGLQNFYNENKNNWKWPNRINAEYFYAESKKSIDKIYSFKKKNKISNDSIISLVNNNSEIKAFFKSEIKEITITNSSLDDISIGLQKPMLKDEKWQITNILEVIPARVKTLEEAEGKIISEYQSQLEKNWISKLKKENKVNVNFKTLYSIKEKP